MVADGIAFDGGPDQERHKLVGRSLPYLRPRTALVHADHRALFRAGPPRGPRRGDRRRSARLRRQQRIPSRAPHRSRRRRRAHRGGARLHRNRRGRRARAPGRHRARRHRPEEDRGGVSGWGSRIAPAGADCRALTRRHHFRGARRCCHHLESFGRAHPRMEGGGDHRAPRRRRQNAAHGSRANSSHSDAGWC